MTILPYIVVGGIVFYYLYENHHPDKTTVPDIDIKQEVKKEKENIPVISDESKWSKQKLPQPIPLPPNVRVKNTYDTKEGIPPIIRNPLLGSTIIDPGNQLNNYNNPLKRNGPVFFSMSNNTLHSKFKSNPNMHSPLTRAIHKNYIVAKF